MNNELYHHGVLGQKWGIRRYQNPDGTLTNAGKKRYQEGSLSKSYQNRLNDLDTAMSRHKRDAIKHLNRFDELNRRRAKPLKARIKDAAKDPIWQISPVTKKGLQKEAVKEWSKVQDASRNVEKGKAETNEILRNMVKNNLYISSTPVSKAAVKGKRYYQTVFRNRQAGAEYKLTHDENRNKYRVDVIGSKYKVSDRKKPGYKHPSEM